MAVSTSGHELDFTTIQTGVSDHDVDHTQQPATIQVHLPEGDKPAVVYKLESAAGMDSLNEGSEDNEKYVDYEDSEATSANLLIDTTDDFAEVFANREKFDSWQDFIELFEEFQRRSQTAFKARSAKSVSTSNVGRVKDQVPEKFVYTAVKMICVHYGVPKLRNEKKPNFKYCGLDCQAFVMVRYRAGYLHISDMNLIHQNHPPESSPEQMDCVIRKIRPVSYTPDMDLKILQVTDEIGIFDPTIPKGRAMNLWYNAFAILQEDECFQFMKQRMFKRRVQFLMETDLDDPRILEAQDPSAVDHGQGDGMGGSPGYPGGMSWGTTAQNPPQRVVTPEMRMLIMKLKEQKAIIDKAGYTPGKKGRKRKCDIIATSAKGRQIKKPKRFVKEEYDDDDDLNSELSFSNIAGDSDAEPSTDYKAPATVSSSSGGEIRSLISYMKKHHEEDKRLRLRDISLRQEEMEIRRQEVEVRQKELEMMREKFEFDKNEKTMLYNIVELLKDQNKIVTMEIHSDEPPPEEQYSVGLT